MVGRQEHKDIYSLLLWDFAFAPDEFARSGLLENGHSWGEVARRVIAELELTSVIQLDCEADMFCVYSEDDAALRQFAEHMVTLTATPQRVLALLGTSSQNTR